MRHRQNETPRSTVNDGDGPFGSNGAHKDSVNVQYKKGLSDVNIDNPFWRTLTETPLLTPEKEHALFTEIATSRNSWRSLVIESPFIRRQLVSDFTEICSNTKALLRTSKDARNARHAKEELRNSVEEITRKMKANFPAIRHLHSQLETLEREGPHSNRKRWCSLSCKVRTLLEETPFVANWFLREQKGSTSRYDQLKELHAALEMTESTADNTAIRMHVGESEKELEDRVINAEKVFLEWKALKEQVAKANLRLVVAIASKYKVRGKTLLDLIGEGALGLYSAIDAYNLTRGNVFSTFATGWVDQAIKTAIKDGGRVIRIHSDFAWELPKIKRAIENHRSGHAGASPSVEEIAATFDMTVQQLENLLQMSSQPQLTPSKSRSNGDDLSQEIANPNVTSEEADAKTTLLRMDITKVLESMSLRDRMLVASVCGIHYRSVTPRTDLPLHLPVVKLNIADDDEGSSEHKDNLTGTAAKFWNTKQNKPVSRAAIGQAFRRLVQMARARLPELEELCMTNAEIDGRLDSKRMNEKRDSDKSEPIIWIQNLVCGRIANNLEREGIHTYCDLRTRSRQQIEEIRNVSSRSLFEIDKALSYWHLPPLMDENQTSREQAEQKVNTD